MPKIILHTIFLLLLGTNLLAQNEIKIKEVNAVRTNATFKIDGELTEEAWKKALEKITVTGVHWLSPANLPDGLWVYYKMTGLPRFIIIDKKGKISEFIAKTPYMFDVYEDLNYLINE